MDAKKKYKAVALYSGGLDSTLAILAVLRQGIDVTAVTFLTHFGCDTSDKSSCSKNPFSAAEKFGFAVKLCHLGDNFIDIVKRPKYGHGTNMNPCIDCRILMLKEAKKFLDIAGADFIITGEVIGQRPMSQMKNTLYMIDRKAGVSGLVLRPLSARIMKPTLPEINGIVVRERLYDFSGRSRKQQMQLAKEFGLTEYPMPAGGCLLTEPNYAYRLRELLNYTPDPSIRELNLLRVGRHFRFSPTCKAIVGRDEKDNNRIQSLAGDDDYLLRVENVGSPLTLLYGPDAESYIIPAASICARYSDARSLYEVNVAVFNRSDCFIIKVSPADEGMLAMLRLERKGKSRNKAKQAIV